MQTNDFALPVTAIDICADNLGAISTAQEFKNSAETKYISTAYHLTRDYVASGTVAVSYVPTTPMSTNGLAKALIRAKLDAINALVGLEEIGPCRVQDEKACEQQLMKHPGTAVGYYAVQ